MLVKEELSEGNYVVISCRKVQFAILIGVKWQLFLNEFIQFTLGGQQDY